MTINANFAAKSLYCLLKLPFTGATRFDWWDHILIFKWLKLQRQFFSKEVGAME